ncbi:MAG: DUF2946 domain-containing protein [Phenylobacterium sp.]
MTGQPQRSDDRKALVALFAVFALLVQALFPAAALAGPRLTPGDLICGVDALHAGSDAGIPAHHRGPGGLPCQDCLAAAMAAIAPPELAVRPVAYVTARVEHAPVAERIAPRARAPPRPPGQGPPTA